MVIELDTATRWLGEFWKSDGDPIAGTLTYHPEDGLTLETTRAFTMENPIGAAANEPLLNGIIGGKRCTLLSLTCVHSSRSLGGFTLGENQGEYRYLVHDFFLGDHVKEDPSLPELQVRFSGLEEWLQRPTAHITITEDNKQFKMETTDSRSSEIRLDAHGCNLFLSDFRGIATGTGHIRPRITGGTTLRIVPDAPQPLSWFGRIIFQFKALLQFGLGDPVAILSEQVPGADGGLPTDIVRQVRRQHIPEYKIHQMVLVGNLDDAKLARLVAAWFTMYDEHKVALDFVATVVARESLYDNVRFTFLVHAFESLHRRTHGGQYMDPEEYEEVRKALVSAIPPNVSNGHRQALKNSAKYGNEYSLRKRLKDLWMELPKEVQPLISENASEFIGKVVDTRNYYAHLDPEIARMNHDDLFRANQSLHRWVTAWMLQNLGVDTVSIREALTKGRF